MNKLNLDFETYCDLDIKKVGAYKYAMHSSCEVLLAGYSIDEGPTQLWDATAHPMPPELRAALDDEDVTIHAFNAQFERLILEHVLAIKLPVQRFRCTQVHAFGLGFTGGLDKVGHQVGIEEGKITEGKELIRFFCQPRKPTKNKPWTRNLPEHDPEKWERFSRYCIRDVDVEMEIGWFLAAYPLREQEWQTYYLDQKINDTGLPVDLKFTAAAKQLVDRETTHVHGEIRKLTGVENPGSRDQMKAWLNANDCPVPNMQGDTLNKATSPNPVTTQVLELLTRVSRSGHKKLNAIDTCAVNDRVHGTLQYMGASRTGRWAGRLIQPQNFVRPPKKYEKRQAECVQRVLDDNVDEEVMEIISAALRGAICAPDGQKFTITDLSGIEGRILPWLCGFQEKLDKISAGLDMYIATYADMFNVPYDSVDGEGRFIGKVAELALGYQGGWRALNKSVEQMGRKPFSQEDAQELVSRWRAANQPIVNYWNAMENAARSALNAPGNEFAANKISFKLEGEFLFMYLPGGRRTAYHLPDPANLSYMGWDSYKRKWIRVSGYGGKFVENATQAVAADVLVHGMHQTDEKGFTICGSVHDEILTAQKPSETHNVDALISCMTALPPWASGLPLNATGYREQRFKKD